MSAGERAEKSGVRTAGNDFVAESGECEGVMMGASMEQEATKREEKEKASSRSSESRAAAGGTCCFRLSSARASYLAAGLRARPGHRREEARPVGGAHVGCAARARQQLLERNLVPRKVEPG